MMCLRDFRFLLTIDLRSEIWKGFLARLDVKKEKEAKSYFTKQHTCERSVTELHAMGIATTQTDPDVVLLFSAHWCGAFGILPGTSSGTTALESRHSCWQAQLDAMGGRRGVEEVLSTMQPVLDRWEDQMKWNSDEALSYMPMQNDTSLLHKKTLAEVGRCSGLELFDAASARCVHKIFPISTDVDAVAVSRLPTLELDVPAAGLGARILQSCGPALVELLAEAGILQEMVAEGEHTSHLCTSLAAVRKHFVNIVYVFVPRPGCSAHPSLPDWKKCICTCGAFAVYGACEHIAFAELVDVRVRPRVHKEDELPEFPRRGRRKGTYTTARGKAKAAAKASQPNTPNTNTDRPENQSKAKKGSRTGMSHRAAAGKAAPEKDGQSCGGDTAVCTEIPTTKRQRCE